MLMLLCLSNCKKPCQTDCNCENPPDFGKHNFENYITVDSLGFSSPCFNPDNENEFIYVEASPTRPGERLCKYNLLSNTKTVLLERNYFAPPKYGRNGMILLNFSDGSIWKMHDDGTELTQLTGGRNCYNLSWNFDHSKFVFNDESIKKGVIMDTNGIASDTLDIHFFNSTAWGTDYHFFYCDNKYYYIFDASNNDYQAIAAGSIAQGGTYGQVWLSPTKILIAADKGVMITGISDIIHTKFIKNSCEALFYMSPTVSDSKTKLILIKVTQFPQDENTMAQHNNIVILNIDGSEERTIPL
jgi:hypothetical protein